MSEEKQTRNVWRSERNVPYCWQEKEILFLLKQKFDNTERAKMMCLYMTLAWIDNDLFGKDIPNYTEEIHEYSGLSIKCIPTGIQRLVDLGIIAIKTEHNKKGHIIAKIIVFTPYNVVSHNPNMPKQPIREKANENPKSLIGNKGIIGQALYKEDYSDVKEPLLDVKEADNSPKSKLTPKQEAEKFFACSLDNNNPEIKAFHEYWSEPNGDGTKQRWELEKTFEIGRRLKKWRSRSFNFKNNKSKPETTRVSETKSSGEVLANMFPNFKNTDSNV